jgi:hypothetical protein
MAVPEPSLSREASFWYRGGTWQHVDAYLTFCLCLKHVRGGTRSVGYRQKLPDMITVFS